ncbi:MAG: DUF3536 domain-containing protein [Armatimonadetes bacterium]|nr:DUF3536 domain-containing protein [Armatimonadota bacterium]
MSALICIHGHFYQPSRENPWLEQVEVDDSAAPYHDWNARITAECYSSNAAARILDAQGRIERIVNNYSAISFNLGPALATWLERNAPEVLGQILRADKERLAALGYGNAIAQPYTHVILPLASRHDKMTQVRWGIADFTRRFGRPPEGMWLPETAVDREVLAVLAECGIAFTILAPHQAARVRAAPAGEWVDVRPEVLDTTRAYLCRPAAGLRIALFFYDGALSRDIAFGNLLDSGAGLAGRLVGVAADAGWAGGRVVHVATDGETYGHHHRFGEMALAYAAEVLERNGSGRLTNYAAFLADHPPTHEVEIHERTSWSCAHGIERWRADCGCRTRPDWHQRWRAPLRAALDWLKAEADALFEEAGARVFHDPWAARDAYIDVVLDRGETSLARFLTVQALRRDDPQDRHTALRLLEMQRHAMLMFASDGWFFDEISRVETVQLLRHAARVIHLAGAGRALEASFLDRLRGAESNLPAFRNGEAAYDRLVRPAMVDARRAAAHYAIMSLFQEFPDDARLYTYRAVRRAMRRLARGPLTLLIGRVEITETLVEHAHDFSFAVLHIGGTDVHCCVAEGWSDGAHATVADALTTVFEGGTVTEVIRRMDEIFGRQFYTLRDLFIEERRHVLARLSEETMAHLEASYRRLYHESRGLMETLRDADVPVPREFVAAAEFILTADLRRALDAPGALSATAWDALAELRSWGLALPAEEFEPLLRARIERRLRDANGLFLVENLAEVERTLDFARDAGITVNLWQAQNLFVERFAPRMGGAAGAGGAGGGEAAGGGAEETVRVALEAIAGRLYFNLDALRVRAGGDPVKAYGSTQY